MKKRRRRKSVSFLIIPVDPGAASEIRPNRLPLQDLICENGMNTSIMNPRNLNIKYSSL